MEKKLRFSIDKAEIIEEDPNDSHFATARIQAFNTGISMHETDCDVETLQKQAYTLYEKPIIFEYLPSMGDFGTHNEKTTVPAGFVVPNTAEFVQTNDGTGRTALVVLAKIWKKYSGKFLQVFQDENQTKKSVSVEMEVNRYEEKPNGVLQLLDFTFAAVCVLGEFITPASPGANIELLSFAKEYAEDYKKEFSSRYSDLDFSIPKSVKNNANKALEKHKEFNSKATSVDLAVARHLIKSDITTHERIRQIHKKFSSGKKDNETIYGMYGGSAGKKFAENLYAQIETADKKEMSYYSEDNFLEEKVNTGEIINDNPIIDNYLGTEMEVENNMAKEVKDEKEEKVDMAKPESEEKPEDEKAEFPEEEKKEKEEGTEKKFSYAEIFGTEEEFAKMFAEEEDDDEDTKGKFAQAKEEFGAGVAPAVMMSAMFAKMCKMAKKLEKMGEDSKVYMAENADLKAKFAEIEKGQKEFAVTSFLKELGEMVVIPEEKFAEFKTESEKFSFAEIDAWKNSCKAMSFDFKNKKSKEKEEDDIVVYALPFNNVKIEDSDDIWASLNK